MPTKTPAVNTAIRLPLDLKEVIDAHCSETPGLTMTAIIVAALRAYLNVRTPAETLGEKRR